MPGAVPSKRLALDELEERNGWFLGKGPQPTHERLLQAAGVPAERVARLKRQDKWYRKWRLWGRLKGKSTVARRYWQHAPSGLAFRASDGGRKASSIVVSSSAEAKRASRRDARRFEHGLRSSALA